MLEKPSCFNKRLAGRSDDHPLVTDATFHSWPGECRLLKTTGHAEPDGVF
jgi:hypothetical protein